MNTKLSYTYRDAANYKQHGTTIMEGELTDEQLQQIMETLNDGELFIPSQVGLMDLQELFYEADKSDLYDSHCWNEIESISSFGLTKEESNTDLTAEQLYNNFMKVNGEWKEYDAEKRYA